MRIVAIAAAVASLMLAGCDSPSATGPEAVDEAFFDGAPLDVSAVESGDPAGFRDVPDGLAGFGGLWFDRSCNLHVVLTADGDAVSIEEALTRLFRRRLAASPRCPEGAGIILHRGQFTYSELSRWLRAMRPLAGIRGVRGIALNIPANRIVVGVANRDVADAVNDALRRLGVPHSAIAFRVVGS